MNLKSTILAGNARLERAAMGGPSVKRRPPDDDADAVKRIQKGLASLGFQMPGSFPNGPGGEPDGIFGRETFLAVTAFQRRVFPKQPNQWDGRVGQLTLARMDDLLNSSGNKPATVPRNELAISQCVMRVPATFS